MQVIRAKIRNFKDDSIVDSAFLTFQEPFHHFLRGNQSVTCSQPLIFCVYKKGLERVKKDGHVSY